MSIFLEVDDPIGEVGSVFTGRLERTPDADGTSSTSRARGVRLVLRYRTEGRGDTDEKVVSSLFFDIEAHGGMSERWSLSIPEDIPISYDGRLIRVLFELEARVDVKFARDPKVERPVLVVPAGGRSVYDRPHPLPPEVLRR